MANSFKRKTSAGIGTGFTPIDGYTVPASTEVTVIGLTVSNVTGSTVKATVSLFDGSTFTSIVTDGPVPAGG